jgi:hypothetical protein
VYLSVTDFLQSHPSFDVMREQLEKSGIISDLRLANTVATVFAPTGTCAGTTHVSTAGLISYNSRPHHILIHQCKQPPTATTSGRCTVIAPCPAVCVRMVSRARCASVLMPLQHPILRAGAAAAASTATRCRTAGCRPSTQEAYTPAAATGAAWASSVSLLN